LSHRDLRDFLSQVEAQGELKRVKGANWDVEMSSIVELIYREGKGDRPAILFDEIPGYPQGYQALFGTIGSTWRIAKTLGLDETRTDPMSLAENWYNKSKNLKLIPPRQVKTGPVTENVMVGDKINILKFPIPRYHEYDKGRYFGTQHAVIQRDPDEDWVNYGTYRVMVVNENTLALHATPGKHGDILTYQKYFANNKAMPVAIAVGMDPVLWWLSCQRDTPWGTSELDAGGAIKGEPIEVVNGEYTGLPFPASAEIVVEGEVRPGDFVEEGPFGEWHGYYGNRGLLTVPEPVIHIKAIYHRNNPIFTGSQPSVPPHTFTLFLGVADAVSIRKRLESFGIPGVKGVWSHYTGSGGLFNVISIQQMYSGHAKEVGLIASQYPAEMGAYTVVVEEDIDPSNLEQVLWAMVTRCRLDRQVQILTECHTNNVNTTIPLKEKRSSDKPLPLTAGRIVIDACRDLSWKEDWYPIARATPELRNQLMEKWKSIFDETGVS
jgi:4-hydroxy-3-polyprenylbenzoate decarboxylase